jgi:hypothetical protein
MKRLVVLAVVMSSLCFTCNAETLKGANCDGALTTAQNQAQQSRKACPVLRVAQKDKRCSCVTYAGTRCTGPCMSAGKPYGCECK